MVSAGTFAQMSCSNLLLPDSTAEFPKQTTAQRPPWRLLKNGWNLFKFNKKTPSKTFPLGITYSKSTRISSTGIPADIYLLKVKNKSTRTTSLQ